MDEYLKRLPPGWTEEDIESLVARVVNRVAEKSWSEEELEKIVGRVMNNFYQEIGKNVVKKALSAIGIGVVTALIWLAGAKAKMWGAP